MNVKVLLYKFEIQYIVNKWKLVNLKKLNLTLEKVNKKIFEK